MLSHDASPPSLSNRLLTLRKARIEARERFLAGRKAESQYGLQLRQVAKQVDVIVRGMAPDGVISDVAELIGVLNRYADLLKPWSESVAGRMIADVSRRDASAWERHSKAIGQSLKREIAEAPTGAAFRAALEEQSRRITLLPRQAAERLYKLTAEALPSGKRASEIAAEVLASGNVTRSEAMMLARTGVSSTATQFTKVRALYIGSEGYTWRTSKDGAVRPSHRAMEGKFVPWDHPPTLDHYTAHCGEFANCRCFPEVAIPDRFGAKR
jgi:SPP1 gp7 family putative phage head morphogenesis protein